MSFGIGITIADDIVLNAQKVFFGTAAAVNTIQWLVAMNLNGTATVGDDIYMPAPSFVHYAQVWDADLGLKYTPINRLTTKLSEGMRLTERYLEGADYDVTNDLVVAAPDVIGAGIVDLGGGVYETLSRVTATIDWQLVLPGVDDSQDNYGIIEILEEELGSPDKGYVVWNNGSYTWTERYDVGLYEEADKCGAGTTLKVKVNAFKGKIQVHHFYGMQPTFVNTGDDSVSGARLTPSIPGPNGERIMVNYDGHDVCTEYTAGARMVAETDSPHKYYYKNFGAQGTTSIVPPLVNNLGMIYEQRLLNPYFVADTEWIPQGSVSTRAWVITGGKLTRPVLAGTKDIVNRVEFPAGFRCRVKLVIDSISTGYLILTKYDGSGWISANIVGAGTHYIDVDPLLVPSEIVLRAPVNTADPVISEFTVWEADFAGSPTNVLDGGRRFDATNLCNNHNDAPTDVSEITLTGDAACTATIVDDSAELLAAGLDCAVPAGLVYKIDNSAGTGPAYVAINGITNTTSEYMTVSAWCRKTGTGTISNIKLAGSVPSETLVLGDTYTRHISIPVIPDTVSRKATFVIDDKDIIYFILNQMETGPDATNLIPLPTGFATTELENVATSVVWNKEGLYNNMGAGHLTTVKSEAEGTNYTYAMQVNPTGLAYHTLGGDTVNGTLTIVDKTADLAAAGLADVCTNGDVYCLDNSAGVSNYFDTIGGAVASDSTAHTMSAFVLGDGYMGYNTGDAEDFVYTTFTRHIRANKMPDTTSSKLRIGARPGEVVYFILMQLEESPIATSIMANTLANGTTIYRHPIRYLVVNPFPPNDWQARGRFVYNENETTNTIFNGNTSSYRLWCTGATIFFKKGPLAAAVSETFVHGQVYHWGCKADSVSGTSVSVGGVVFRHPTETGDWSQGGAMVIGTNRLYTGPPLGLSDFQMITGGDASDQVDWFTETAWSEED